MFKPEEYEREETPAADKPLFDHAKMTVKVPADLYEAVRIAARVEGKSRNQLVVDILTEALSRLPEPPED